MSGTKLELIEVAGVILTKLDGEIDLSNADDIEAELSSRMPNSASGLVIDLSGITYLDSSGVRLLFSLAERLDKRQQQLVLAVPEQAPVRRVLTIVSLDKQVPLTPSIDHAKALLAERS